jgi:hypothetical protein
MSRDERVISTNAIYADAMRGKCPACDDFIEDSRTLEIEARQLENRERELGLERVKLQNAILQNDPVPRRVIQFEGLPDGATVHVHLRDSDESARTSIESKPGNA